MYIKRDLTQPCFKIGYNIINRKGPVLLGISPGNSYYKQPVICNLLQFVSQVFSKIIIQIPDRPYEYTLEARGYSVEKAQRIARLQGSRLKNLCLQAIATLELPQLQFYVADWRHEVDTNPLVSQGISYIIDLYNSNAIFRQDIRAATHLVVQHQHNLSEEGIEAALDIGVKYLLEEFGLIKVSPQLYNVEALAIAYHRHWPILEDLIDGKYGHHLPNLGFVIIEE